MQTRSVGFSFIYLVSIKGISEGSLRKKKKKGLHVSEARRNIDARSGNCNLKGDEKREKKIQ